MMLKKPFGGYVMARIILNPCPQSRVITRDESSIQKLEEEQSVDEEDPQEENLESSSSKEMNDSWITCDDDQTLEPEIEEFLACISKYPPCISNFVQVTLEEFYDMTTNNFVNEHQVNKYHLKTWS